MIERYSRPQMSAVWTDSAKLDAWLEVELKVCESLSGLGQIPKKSFETIKNKAAYNIDRIATIESEVHHDVIAFLSSLAETVGEDARFIHMGLTSSDLLDTAFALQLKKAGEILKEDVLKLMGVLKKRAFEFKDTPMMGRSHGIHAEPITFGLKFAVWYSEFSRHLARLSKAVQDVAVGKISGAVGTFAHIDPRVERDVMAKLELAAAPVSTQIVQRDSHAHFFCVLAGIAATVEKVALEIRHLQRTEVGEVSEPFGVGQKGSSAMPHKRNPVLCENLTGLARIVRANALASLENVALWHERDISHSSVERIIAPDSTILLDFMLSRLVSILDGLDVYPEKMLKNIERSLGLHNSQEVLLALMKRGKAREDAYKLVQSAAQRSWREEKPFLDILLADGEISKMIGEAELKKIFDIRIHFKHVDEIFKRVF